jgi:hypothetical protein
MRRAYRQPRHHQAQQPRSYAGRGFDGRLHSVIILRQGIAAAVRGRSGIRFGSPPDDGLHGNNQISGEAQDVLWKLEERKVRIADHSGVIAVQLAYERGAVYVS